MWYPRPIARITIHAAIAMALLAAAPATPAQEAGEKTLEELREELEALKGHIRKLEERIDGLARAEIPAPAMPQPPAPPSSGPTTLARGPASATVFNPAISAVFQGIGNFSVDHDRDEDGFSLAEAEIGIQAAVDPFARVDLFLSFTSEGAEVEEGYVTSSSLPGGLQLKGGRFKSAYGKWNTLHDHRFFTVEQPEVLAVFFGEEGLVADGASLGWLIPGTGSVYLESTSQVASTGNDISFNGRSRDLLFLQRIESVFPLTSNSTLGLGVSGTSGKVGPTEELLEELEDAGLTDSLEPADDLSSAVLGADFTFKWKPVQYNVYRSFLLQGEYLFSRRRIQELESDGTLERDTLESSGLYGYAEYQFAKRWRSGVRYDFTRLPDDEDARVQAISGIVTFRPSEFQEFRIQFKHTGRNEAGAARFDDIENDNEFFIEWIPAIGSHPAHAY